MEMDKNNISKNSKKWNINSKEEDKHYMNKNEKTFEKHDTVSTIASPTHTAASPKSSPVFAPGDHRNNKSAAVSPKFSPEHIYANAKSLRTTCSGLSDRDSFGLSSHYHDKLVQLEENDFRESSRDASGFTLMHLAAKKNNADLINYLYESNAKLELQMVDDFGRKPVDCCNKNMKDSVYNLLLKLMDTVDKDDEMEKKYEAFKNARKSEIAERKSKKESSKMELKMMMKNPEIAKGEGIKEEHNTGCNMDEVEMMAPPEYKKVCKIVAKGGWNNVKWPKGQTLLHWAARKGHEDICKYLIFEFDANPTTEDDKGKTPIDMAKLGKHRKLMVALRKKFQ